MRVYAIGNEGELEELRIFCEANKWNFVPMRGAIGRPTVQICLQKVLVAYERERSVSLVARTLEMAESTTRRILKEAGVLESNR